MKTKCNLDKRKVKKYSIEINDWVERNEEKKK